MLLSTHSGIPPAKIDGGGGRETESGITMSITITHKGKSSKEESSVKETAAARRRDDRKKHEEKTSLQQ